MFYNTKRYRLITPAYKYRDVPMYSEVLVRVTSFSFVGLKWQVNFEKVLACFVFKYQNSEISRAFFFFFGYLWENTYTACGHQVEYIQQMFC